MWEPYDSTSDVSFEEVAMDNIEIKGIILNIGDKEVNLTIKEARKLKAVLDELFKVEVKETHHHHNNDWNQPYVNPTITYIDGDTSGSPMPGLTPNVWCSTALTDDVKLENISASDGTSGTDAAPFLSIKI